MTMVVPSHPFHRVRTVGRDFVYQSTADFDPDCTVYCPHCWDKRKIKVALPPAGESGYSVCYSCRTATQLQVPSDFDLYYSLED